MSLLVIFYNLPNLPIDLPTEEVFLIWIVLFRTLMFVDVGEPPDRVFSSLNPPNNPGETKEALLYEDNDLY